MAAPRRYAALLRGVNVGGSSKVSMARLREICDSIGCTDVATYIQSGNAVFSSKLEAAELCATLERAIADQIGVSTVVVARTRAEVASVISRNPFAGADTGNLHVAFLTAELDREAAASLDDLDFPPEELAARGAQIYLHLPNGMGRAKIPALLERRVRTPMTVRNWRTVTKLRELLDG